MTSVELRASRALLLYRQKSKGSRANVYVSCKEGALYHRLPAGSPVESFVVTNTEEYVADK